MNKKGQTRVFAVLWFVLSFMLVITAYSFYSIFLYEIGADNVIEPLTNLTLDVAILNNISTNMTQAILDYETSYGDNQPPFDLYFMLVFIAFFISSLIFAASSRKEGPMGLLGMATMGVAGFLLIFGFIEQVQTWMIENLIIGVLEFDLTLTPFLNFYFANVALINLVWAVCIILVNQWDTIVGRTQISTKGRVQP